MDQPLGSFGGLTVLGIDFVRCRGVSPSTGLMTIVPLPAFDRVVDDLTLSYGGNFVTMTDVAAKGVSTQIHEGREAFRWQVALQDRRWRWRYPRISGTYNRRLCDGTVEPIGKKSARELGDMLALELADKIDVAALPENVFPPVVWENAIARWELAWLCDLFALTVAPLNNNQFKLVPVTATASLPAGGELITPPASSFKPGVMPSDLRVQGDIKKTQDWVPLQAICLGKDGLWELLDDVHYKPLGGWQDQWWHVYPDVLPEHRHLAFQTVYRLYSPVDPSIVLSDYVIETGRDVPAGEGRCLPAQVRGVFFSHDDFGTTTPSTAIYNGKWRLRKDLNAIEFCYPVFKLVGGLVQPAELQINCAYHTVDSDGNPLEFYMRNKNIPQAPLATKPRVLQHPELKYGNIVSPIYGGSVGNNGSALDAEADGYLVPVAAGYAYDQAQDGLYDRLIFPDLSAGYSQVKWNFRTGVNHRVATTRVGVNTEVDITEMHMQQRRALERLNQMAERMRL